MQIAIANDGSQSSQMALNWAAKLFPRGHEFVVVHVVADLFKDTSLLSRSMVPEALAAIQAGLSEEAGRIVRNAVALLTSQALKAVGAKLLYGHPIEQLCRFGEHEASDLMIMGRRGLNPLKSFFLGSVSDGVLRYSTASILLTPPTSRQGPPADGKKLRLVVAYDGSAASLRIIDFLKKWAPRDVEELCLVTVMRANFTYGIANALDQVSIKEKLVSESRVELDKRRDDLLEVLPSASVHSHVISDALDISSAIEHFAQQQRAHLTIVGSKGHNRFETIVLGSVAYKLAHHTSQALLVVR